MESNVGQLLANGKQEIALDLIKKNPTLATSKDDSGRFPIHWAASFGFKEIFNFLLEQGIDVNIRDDSNLTPLIIASSAGKIDIVQELLKKPNIDVNAMSNGGHSSLQYASSKNHYEIVELLLESNANPNVADELNSTPLHRASSQGHVNIVDLLLNKGKAKKIDLNLKDSFGNTPLHLACEEDRVEVIKRLIKAGANLEIKNKEEKLPLDLIISDTSKATIRTFLASK